MSDRFDWIFPCHGSSRVKPEIIKELLNGVAKMRKGLISPKEAVYLDTNVKEYDLGPAVFLYDDWVTFPE